MVEIRWTLSVYTRKVLRGGIFDDMQDVTNIQDVTNAQDIFNIDSAENLVNYLKIDGVRPSAVERGCVTFSHYKDNLKVTPDEMRKFSDATGVRKFKFDGVELLEGDYEGFFIESINAIISSPVKNANVYTILLTIDTQDINHSSFVATSLELRGMFPNDTNILRYTCALCMSREKEVLKILGKPYDRYQDCARQGELTITNVSGEVYDGILDLFGFPSAPGSLSVCDRNMTGFEIRGVYEHI